MRSTGAKEADSAGTKLIEEINQFCNFKTAYSNLARYSPAQRRHECDQADLLEIYRFAARVGAGDDLDWREFILRAVIVGNKGRDEQLLNWMTEINPIASNHMFRGSKLTARQ